MNFLDLHILLWGDSYENEYKRTRKARTTKESK